MIHTPGTSERRFNEGDFVRVEYREDLGRCRVLYYDGVDGSVQVETNIDQAPTPPVRLWFDGAFIYPESWK